MERRIFAVLSLCLLAACLFLPVLHFFKGLGVQKMKTFFFLASLGWFFFASLWLWAKKRNKS